MIVNRFKLLSKSLAVFIIPCGLKNVDNSKETRIARKKEPLRIFVENQEAGNSYQFV